MTLQEREKAAFHELDNGNPDQAIEHAKRVPAGWNMFERMASHPNLSESHAQKIIQYLSNKYSPHHSDKASFLFEHASSLPANTSAEHLNFLARHIKDDHYAAGKIKTHPNWKPDQDLKNQQDAAAFWENYEKRVSPHHFAIVKSMFTGKPEELKDHRGEVGASHGFLMIPSGGVFRLPTEPYEKERIIKDTGIDPDRNGIDTGSIIPHLQTHAKNVQDLVMNDETIPKRHINGKPHIKLYRGVNGHYGKIIRDKSNYNPNTQEIDKKTFQIPTAHLTSWTVNPQIAGRFAHRKIEGQPNDQGVVMSQWIPVENILHSGMHSTVFDQTHPHSHEEEIVVGHPEGKYKISTSNMEMQPSVSKEGTKPTYGSTIKPNIRPKDLKKNDDFNDFIDLTDNFLLAKVDSSNIDLKSMKLKFIPAATALAILGAEQKTDVGIIPQHELPHIVQQQAKDVKPAHHIPKEVSKMHPDLAPIKMIESNNGKNTKHKPMTNGENANTVAFGLFGLMPLTITDVASKTPSINRKYPELAAMDYTVDNDKIHDYMKQHPDAEYDIANSHWRHLTNTFGNDKDRAVYAWLNGIGGAKKADDNTIKNHYYVEKYHKYEKMLNLEKKDLKKSDVFNDKKKIEKFVGFTDIKQNERDLMSINAAIATGNIHNLKNVGHFTHDSFIAGYDPDNSWLLKLEPFGHKSAIKSAKDGLQSIKEVAFYYLADKVFGLSEFTPKAILGETVKDSVSIPTAAIKMYPEVFLSGKDISKTHPGMMRTILEPFRRNGTLTKLAILLYINGDVDAHGGNILSNGKDIKLIDHGTSFANKDMNPHKDSDIFVPYFLRMWGYKDRLSTQERYDKLPKIDDPVIRTEVTHWLMSIDSFELSNLLNKFYIDPAPVLQRLAELQKLATHERIDSVINKAWIFGTN